MDKNYKQKWIEALRSGEYKQCQNVLRNEDRFCCLGVLCDIYDNTRWENNLYQNHLTEVPNNILNVLDIPSSEQAILINLNDISGLNFNRIADYIEQNL